jgi:hypothetical protein
MGTLAAMKHDLHDRLWQAQQNWFALKAQGATHHAVKTEGIREAGDPNRMIRGILFTGRTRTTYEQALKGFVEYAHDVHGVRSLDDIRAGHARAYLEHGIRSGWSESTLDKTRSALAKFGALAGKTESFAAVSRKYGPIIRECRRGGLVAGPSRSTPSKETVERAIEKLREGDEKAGWPRAYHLAAGLQVETGARAISVTERFTRASLREGSRVEIVGKGGKVQSFEVSAGLHARLREHLDRHPGPLADRDGYRMAYARAVEAVGGRVTGTHGVRRQSTQEFYAERFREYRARGYTRREARRAARRDAVERLGHGRERTDVAGRYLGGVA